MGRPRETRAVENRRASLSYQAPFSWDLTGEKEAAWGSRHHLTHSSMWPDKASISETGTHFTAKNTEL